MDNRQYGSIDTILRETVNYTLLMERECNFQFIIHRITDESEIKIL